MRRGDFEYLDPFRNSLLDGTFQLQRKAKSGTDDCYDFVRNKGLTRTERSCFEMKRIRKKKERNHECGAVSKRYFRDLFVVERMFGLWLEHRQMKFVLFVLINPSFEISFIRVLFGLTRLLRRFYFAGFRFSSCFCQLSLRNLPLRALSNVQCQEKNKTKQSPFAVYFIWNTQPRDAHRKEL